MENFVNQLNKIESNSLQLLAYLEIYMEYYIEMKYNIATKRTNKKVPFQVGLDRYMAQNHIQCVFSHSNKDLGEWVLDDVIEEERIYREFIPITFSETLHMCKNGNVTLYQFKKITESIIKKLKNI